MTTERPAFEQVYDDWFDFVWCSVRRLGAPSAAVDDAVQDVFVVIHEKLPTFEGRSSLKTWIFGITLNVVRRHQRKALRHRGDEDVVVLPSPDPGPADGVEQNEAVALLYRFLDEMDDRRRTVFVMSEIEQRTVPDIAEELGENTNTIYSRVRAAREDFENRIRRFRAQEDSRVKRMSGGHNG